MTPSITSITSTPRLLEGVNTAVIPSALTRQPTTVYLSVDDVARIVQTWGLPRCIARVAAQIETEFRRWHAFDKSARVACHSTHGVIELMPIACAQQFAFKYVNGHPKNTRDGLPTVMAFGVLADVDTGAPRLLSELTITTAIRTAAMSALAAQKLARPGSRRMALIGNGAQSEFQALAFRDLVGIRELRLFDSDPAATAKLCANLAGSGLQLTVCASAAEAARGADIITTVTADKANATIVTPEMIEPGMHLNAVGGDCPGKTELHPEVLRAGSVFCEFEPQTRIEGDIQQMPADFAVTEFWQVLQGHHPGRRNAKELTVFDSVGFALEDYAALRVLNEAAAELGIGELMDLVPQPRDPKNLFGELQRRAPPCTRLKKSPTLPAFTPHPGPQPPGRGRAGHFLTLTLIELDELSVLRRDALGPVRQGRGHGSWSAHANPDGAGHGAGHGADRRRASRSSACVWSVR